MNKQLTGAQIESLHMFCAKHYVPYYDVQVELVDHLASAIENRWENEPNIGFEQALNDVYSAFGIYGFSKIKQMKEKELKRKYFKLRNRYIREFFRMPKILFFFLVFVTTKYLFFWSC